jgi:hypothetical protein
MEVVMKRCTTHLSLTLFAAILLGLTTALAGVAHAARIAYEGVEYSPGPLAPNGPPLLGFSAAWAADPGVMVVGGGLSGMSGSLALPSAGGAVAGAFNYQAPLSSTIAPTVGKEFWASFLINHGAPNDQTFMGLSPSGSPFGAPPSVAFGVRLGQYGIFVGSTFTACGKPYTAAGSTDFLVMHFTAGGAVWNVQLFVNPSSFTAPDLSMSVAPVTYGTMVNMNETGFESDEFRLGDTAGDVAAATVDVAPDAANPQVELSVAPTPSHGLARIAFTVTRDATVRLTVVDVQGRTIATLADGVFPAGRHYATWNAGAGNAATSAGLYFLRYVSQGTTTTRKLILTR